MTQVIVHSPMCEGGGMCCVSVWVREWVRYWVIEWGSEWASEVQRSVRRGCQGIVRLKGDGIAIGIFPHRIFFWESKCDDCCAFCGTDGAREALPRILTSSAVPFGKEEVHGVKEMYAITRNVRLRTTSWDSERGSDEWLSLCGEHSVYARFQGDVDLFHGKKCRSSVISRGFVWPGRLERPDRRGDQELSVIIYPRATTSGWCGCILDGDISGNQGGQIK